eukprot:scaffold732_cov348-Pavlova_lutheri.AAC.1
MENCRVKQVPLEHHFTPLENEPTTPQQSYQVLMGSLLYLATTTRSDLCHEVSHLSRFMDTPSMEHMNAAKSVLKYLRGTMDLGLIVISLTSLVTMIVVVLVTRTANHRAVSLDESTFREAEQGGWCGRVENLSTLESWSQEGSGSITKSRERS